MYVNLHQQKQRQAIRNGLIKTWKIKLGHANGHVLFIRLTAMVGTQTKEDQADRIVDTDNPVNVDVTSPHNQFEASTSRPFQR